MYSCTGVMGTKAPSAREREPTQRQKELTRTLGRRSVPKRCAGPIESNRGNGFRLASPNLSHSHLCPLQASWPAPVLHVCVGHACSCVRPTQNVHACVACARPTQPVHAYVAVCGVAGGGSHLNLFRLTAPPLLPCGARAAWLHLGCMPGHRPIPPLLAAGLSVTPPARRPCGVLPSCFPSCPGSW